MRILIALLTLSFLTACDTPMPQPPEPLRFTGPAYTFNVASIAVVKDYHSPKRLPNVEHLSDITPSKAVEQWAGTRLVAAGHSHTMEVDIKDASIVRHDVPKQKTGIEGYFTTEQTEQYEGSLDVEIKIYGDRSPLPVARLEATATQTQTLAENATVSDRKRLYHDMTVDLLHEIEPKIDIEIHHHLANYLL